ncbi:MAG TPA: inositol monophosphatase family protein [Solirubrobacteraceae bacterium]|nr:inositol monophosphatase family protein [Solirubrobacteraceae bacterium]
MAAASDDLSLALELADVADEITRARFRASDLVVETKPDLTPVTEADTAVERALRAQLETLRPDDAVLGEEYGVSEGASEQGRRWIIDPIDGTKNYVRGIPVWATLLALQGGDGEGVGVVSAPALGRRWWAAQGEGAFAVDLLSEEPRRLRVSAVSALSDAQLCISGFDGWDASAGGLERLLSLARQCWRTRGFGDFWTYMLIAEGVADVGCEPVVSLWDLAAPQVIVEEAGGTFTDLGGVRTAAGGDALATNGVLHEQALAIVGR